MFSQEFSGLQKLATTVETLKCSREFIDHNHGVYTQKNTYNPYKLYSENTLKQFDLDKIFVCNLKTLYDKYFVGRPFGDNIISIFDLETLRPKQWLRNNIVNAGIVILLDENKCTYKALPVQIDFYAFQNHQKLVEASSTSILIPHIIDNHYYLIILNIKSR